MWLQNPRDFQGAIVTWNEWNDDGAMAPSTFDSKTWTTASAVVTPPGCICIIHIYIYTYIYIYIYIYIHIYICSVCVCAAIWVLSTSSPRTSTWQRLMRLADFSSSSNSAFFRRWNIHGIMGCFIGFYGDVVRVAQEKMVEWKIGISLRCFHITQLWTIGV